MRGTVHSQPCTHVLMCMHATTCTMLSETCTCGALCTHGHARVFSCVCMQAHTQCSQRHAHMGTVHSPACTHVLTCVHASTHKYTRLPWSCTHGALCSWARTCVLTCTRSGTCTMLSEACTLRHCALVHSRTHPHTFLCSLVQIRPAEPTHCSGLELPVR